MQTYHIQHSPVQPVIAQLQPGESHFHSFRLIEATKQWFNFKPLPFVYRCHLTDQRLILEPEANSIPKDSALLPFITFNDANQPFVQISREAIQTLSTVRPLSLTPHVQLTFWNTEANAAVFTVSPVEQLGPRNYCKDFVQLCNEIFQLGPDLPYPIDAAEVARFQAEMATEQLPVLVDFWAPGCQPCQTLAPVIQEIAEQYSGKLTLIKINIEQNPSIPLHYGIDCFPTLLLFKAGSIVDQITGTVPKFMLARMLAKHMG